ncbi:MAG: chromate transporter [Hornefia sp.]|nr:chromate transporter [Hornefia sp.]
MNEIFLLAYHFFITGLFAVGGGLATLPFLYDMGRKTGWFDAADVANMVAIAQSTPGPTGINMATYVGFHRFGILGAVVGTASIVFPSIVIIIIISKALTRFKDSQLVQDIFYGLRPASTGLILAAAFGVIQISLINMGNTGDFIDYFRFPELTLAALIFLLHKWKKPHPIFLIVMAGIIGVVFKI